MGFDRFIRLFERVQTYPWWQVAVEVLVIGIVVYAIIRFVQGTRAAGALKSVLLLLLVATLLIRVAGGPEAFQRLKFLYDNFLALVAVALIVIFQPELRRGLIRLGEGSFWRRGPAGDISTVQAIADAAGYLSKARFGGLIVVQRDVGLKGLIEGGTALDAQVSARLLQALFFPGSALHDLAVIIHQGRIRSAGVQLPLADPDEMPDPSLGSRHRAAVGLSKECDALVVVISEETGHISIAERGKLDQNLGVDGLKDSLLARLSVPSQGDTLGAGGTASGPEPMPEGIGDPRD